jgi:hypothetical protein
MAFRTRIEHQPRYYSKAAYWQQWVLAGSRQAGVPLQLVRSPGRRRRAGREGLVQIVVHEVDAEIARAEDAGERVHIGTVAVITGRLEKS